VLALMDDRPTFEEFANLRQARQWDDLP